MMSGDRPSLIDWRRVITIDPSVVGLLPAMCPPRWLSRVPGLKATASATNAQLRRGVATAVCFVLGLSKFRERSRGKPYVQVSNSAGMRSLRARGRLGRGARAITGQACAEIRDRAILRQ